MSSARPIVLHAPVRLDSPEGVDISASIDWGGESLGFPDRLWFRIPPRQAEWLSDRADPFLTSMSMVAMRRRRPLRVEGLASARLGSGLKEFARYFATTLPDRFGAVPVEAEQWTRDPPSRAGSAVASTFSGGVDSFHTVFRHNDAQDTNPAARVTHALFISGFDLRTAAQRNVYEAYAARVEPVLSDIGVRMVRIETNARQFMPFVDWTHMHGTVLAACAQMLSGLVGMLYVPSSTIVGGTWQAVWGTGPATDYLLGTETLQIVHDSVDLNRPDKMLAMRGWKPFMENMRVCLHPAPGILNCGRCEKCIRTLVQLEIADMLEAATTFSAEARRDMWRHASWVHPGLSWDAWYMRGEALARNRPDVARRLAIVHAKDLLKRARRRMTG